MSEAPDATAPESGAPPYISFRTLLNLVERMADEGVPRRIDRTFLAGLSGGYQTQVMAALRFLGLMADNGIVQQRLLDLVERPKERPALIGQILRERFPELVALGEGNATQGELEEEFKKLGISGATLRKAVAFYLHAATYAGIPVSPFFRKPSVSDARATPRRRRTRTARDATPPTVDPTPESSPTSAEALRNRYIEMLMKRVGEQDEVDDKLLDRIEALLGFRGSQAHDEGENPK